MRLKPKCRLRNVGANTDKRENSERIVKLQLFMLFLARTS
jgi:hypothetical protein